MGNEEMTFVAAIAVLAGWYCLARLAATREAPSPATTASSGPPSRLMPTGVVFALLSGWVLTIIWLLGGLDFISPYAAAKSAVRREMRDPDAAQFREMGGCFKDKAIVKGEVNGKNAYGAYTGFRPFYFADGRAVLANTEDLFGGSEFEEVARRCDGYGPVVNPQTPDQGAIP